MSPPRYARLASRFLVRAERSVPVTGPAADSRAAAIAAIAGKIRARARERRVRRWVTSIAAVAAVGAVTVGVERSLAHRGQLGASTAGTPATPDGVRIVAHTVGGGVAGTPAGARGGDSWSLGAGSRVLAPLDGRVMLSFSTGTTAVLRESTDLTVVGVASMQVLRVDAGSVDLHVAKLVAGERFLIDTSDAEVEVRGTQFTVSIVPPEPWCGGGTVTRVVVTEGVVVVRRGGGEVRVGAGEEWPGGCVRPPSGPPVLASDLPRAASTATASPSSTLGEQNALFAAAVAARRRGDTRAALAALDRFLATYPASPLEESASVERLRLLRASVPSRDEAAAREYLARYPGGFARREAEAILARER